MFSLRRQFEHPDTSAASPWPAWPLELPLAKIDMHCHSSFSIERLHFLPSLVWRPLLTPTELYDAAKARGMSYVTITDHDSIDGCKALLDERGELPDFIVGEEVTTRFPEDGTIIHVNVYDITEREHAEIQRLRENVYELVAHLRLMDKLFVLNHMTWTGQHRVLKAWQIVRMLELFDVFEGINGTRSYAHNAFTWHATGGRGKVLVGGSDSHTLRVGTTYTRTLGSSRQELLASVRAGYAVPCGGFGTPEKLREDVWLSVQRNVERRLAEATGAIERLKYRAMRGFVRVVHPLLCVGYHAHQDYIIRDCLRALPG